MNYTTILQILGTGVVAAVLTQLFTWVREHMRDQNKLYIDRRYIALQVAVSLESFSIDCATRISNVEQSLDDFYQGGRVAPEVFGLPTLVLPRSEDWRWIATELASEVLSLSPHIQFSEGAIRFTLDIADSHSAAEEAQLQLGLRGFDSWRLAQRVRQYYGIACANYDLNSWDFVKTLSDAAMRRASPS
jgi:hypothetical protein